ncbi:MAG: fibronectin type III domain-containing protein, partial [Treponema sp.]|nr:fibronectin type III domain-containing protein [Treponema sp.]
MELKQKIMGRVKVLTALSFTLVHLWAMVSCQNELLPVPTGIKEQTSREAAPEHFVASHGRQKIHLSWSPVAGAQGYRIYASDLMTPTEESFVQVTYVTQSETPVAEIDVKPGSEAWYRVSAILSNGSETVASKSLRATSLATPEITDIQTDSDDATVLTVYWNMSNCRDDTYRKQTEYTITCISSIDTVSRTVKATQLQETCFTMTGLMAHTSYSCKITARTEFGDESESSEISAETLHQLQPQAPVALEASLGDDKNGITLSFKLPEKADLQRKDDGSFEKSPIRFTVYRREKGNESWQKIKENPSLTKPDGSTFTTGDYPDDGGLDVSWKDTNVPQRGVIYEYKVQSFVDLAAFKGTSLTDEQLKKSYNYIETSSTVSSATTSGWRMAAPSLSTNSASYSTIPSPENPAVYTEAVLEEGGLIFSWNNFLLDSSVANANLAAKYKYLLYEHMKPFDCDKKSDSDVGTIKMVGAYSSSADLGKYKRQFNLSGGQSGDRGKYSYIVYIVPESYPTPSIGSSPDSSLPGDDKSGCAETPTSIAVTDNAGSIEGFTVKGGFSNKFIISWNNQSGTKYSLTYTEMVDGKITASDEKIPEIFEKEYTGSTVTETNTFEQQTKGVTRIYRLMAEPNQGSAPISETSEPCYSLGTPEPQFDTSNPYYDSITVSWEKVQAAQSYKVQLAGENPVDIITEGESANIRTSRDQLGNIVYSYTFTPDQLGARYTDASLAGKGNTITVSATSEENDTTNGKVENTRVLGPAEIGLTTTVAQTYKSISTTWKKIDGAKAYQILRKRYTSNGSGGWKADEDDWETFIYDAENEKVISNGEQYSPMTVTQGVKKE